MNRPACSALTAILLACPFVVLADEAADTFNKLYGDDLKRVTATPSAADDVALGKQMLEDAKKAGDQPAFLALLCEKAYELAGKDASGYATATAAMDLLAEKVPEKKVECLQKSAGLYQKQYATSRGEARTKAGEMVITALGALAEAQIDAGDFDAAGLTLRQALAVAMAIKSESKAAIQAQLAGLASQQQVEKEIAALKAKLGKDPQDAASRKEIVRLYLVEMDNPAEAAKFVDETLDEATRKYVPAAVKAVEEAPELACAKLGDWYMGLVGQAATLASKGAMLRRAQGYYQRFLELHTDEDLTRTIATRTLKMIEDALAKCSAVRGKGQWIDLLKLADPARDAVNGKWARVGETLTLAPAWNGRIMIPVIPLGSYELQVKFVRVTGRESVDIILPVGSAGVAAVLSGWGGSVSGLTCVNGRPAADNETKVSPGQLENGREYTAGIQVKIARDQAVIAVDLNGRPYIRWSGPHAVLSVDGGKRLPDPKALGVGGTAAEIVFRSVRLRMLSGEAKLLRP
jgi:tetratricopeptide (TPR) repeat protein